jgi:CheY-like chemotaxis protein
MISEVLTIILRQAGWEVFTVENGRECVERFEAGRFDVILMDIQMPQMNGYEAARTIREKENGGNPIPIIALTAHALDEAREKSRKSGMNGYLTKPVDRDQLIAMVRSMLKAA